MSRRFLSRPAGRLAYSVVGNGPAVLCLPGMGDLRHSYRHLAPLLAHAGFTVISMDLRGHGDCDTTFSEYGDEATAADISAFVRERGEPVVVIGNSMAAGAAVIAAAREPQAIAGLVLVGPFVRDPQISRAKAFIFKAAMMRPWARRVWTSYLPSLYAGRKPDDLSFYIAQVSDSLRDPGRLAAFLATTRTSHQVAESMLDRVQVPTLVLMGAEDPDFTDPRAEAEWVGQRLDAQVAMVEAAGHYVHAQQPEQAARIILGFLERIGHGASRT